MTPTITAKDAVAALGDCASQATIIVDTKGKIKCELVGFWNGRNLAAAIKALRRQYRVRKYELVKSQKKEAKQ